MQTIRSIKQLREEIASERQAGRRIAFVPTMGNLHDGHLQLVEQAKQHADCVVVSIFVNPLQFSVNEDLAAYPRTFAEDGDKLQDSGIAILFSPELQDVYPRPMAELTRVSVPGLSDLWCGASRPGHFDGVTTVVSKLFNMVRPDVALFGEKDFQQLLLIRRMVADLDIPVEIVGVPIVREPSGLAMSSRNGYLTDEQREQAPLLYQCLQGMAAKIKSGREDFRLLEEQGRTLLDGQGFKTDYLAICSGDTLSPATAPQQGLVILVAAWLGKARLLDNLPLIEG